LEICGDILEERENPVLRVFVPEDVEDEAVFGHERVSVRWNPLSHCRFETPRKRMKLKIKKAIAFGSGTSALTRFTPENLKSCLPLCLIAEEK
jgi:ribosomal protein L11 methylase PrmA